MCSPFLPQSQGASAELWLKASSQRSAALPALGWCLLRTRHPCEIELVFCCSQVQIKAAKQRVVMASLYLGTGLLEQELVSVEGFGEAGKGMQGRGVEGRHMALLV